MVRSARVSVIVGRPALYGSESRKRGWRMDDGRWSSRAFAILHPLSSILAFATLTAVSTVLIGYRGSGKSTIGERLADRLWQKFVDTDDLVIKKAGKPI